MRRSVCASTCCVCVCTRRKKLDLSRSGRVGGEGGGGGDVKRRRAQRRVVGRRSGGEDCLFWAGQTRLSSTFSHADESARRGGRTRQGEIRRGRRRVRGRRGSRGGDRLIYEAGLARVFEGPTWCCWSLAVSLDSGDGLPRKKNSLGV